MLVRNANREDSDQTAYKQSDLELLCLFRPFWQVTTVVPTKSDSDIMFCLQSYQGLIIDRSIVY